MRIRTVVLTLVAAAILLAAVPFVYARGWRGHRAGMMMAGPEGMMFGHFGRIRAELGLTDEQVSQLKAVRTDLQAQNAPYREQLKGGFGAVIETLLKDPDNVAGAQAIIDQHAAAKKAMQVNVLNAASRALKVLTPEQRAKAADLIQRRAEAFHRMHEER